jgi:hypothetical protein
MIPGGGSLRTGDPIYQFNEKGELVKKWDNLKTVSEYFNCNDCTFRNALHFKEKYFGYFWSRNESIDLSEFSHGDAKKPVYKYLKNGKLIERYESLLDAAKMNNEKPSTLLNAIQGQSLFRKEFYYSYQLYDTFIVKPRISLKNKQFYIYDLQGNYLQTIENCDKLREFMGVKSNSSIHDVINRRNGLYKTFQIKTEYFEHIDPIQNKSKHKKVDVFDKEGNFIKTCESVAKAAKEFNTKSSNINRVLRGLACTTAGYIFKFSKDNDIV